MAKKAKSVKEQTLEQKLWGAAEKLRGNLDAAEYKSVVLGLVFLKYINDSFKAKYEELTSDPYGDPEDADEYIGDNIFFVPKESRWKLIADSALTAEIGIVIDKAMEAIEKDNAHLKGILPKNYARPELDKRRLGESLIFLTIPYLMSVKQEMSWVEFTNISLENLRVKKGKKVESSILRSA